MENIVIVDTQDRLIGTRPRSEITFDDIFRVSALWIIDQNVKVLIAQRSLSLARFPGLWTAAVAGTNAENETYESNILKEAKEELSLTLNPEYLTYLGTVFISDTRQFFRGVFLYRYQNEPFTINPAEVSKTEWIPAAQLSQELDKAKNRFMPTVDVSWRIVRTYLHNKDN